ncbi:DUF2971 domain-containing protein [Pantoea ananatis]|uniref:DUF2971 domain-containing protein n=1 Tax=Pantoea ananas TaxID=553 RepID=UPI00041BA86D|nr:DUF2971 domain-containing protein [Pantoea ananatis]ASN13918.1 DUF2971 domain-containing protein [Pantoea ananatis]
MFLYKFYRPGENFNKALRYSEIYFSSNKQLNDPNDLKAKYYFEDNVDLWHRLLHSEAPMGPSLTTFLKLENKQLSNGLNDIFKGIKVDANAKSLNQIFDINKEKIESLIRSSIKDLAEIPDSHYFSIEDPVPFFVESCMFGLKELAFKGIKTEVYSVSFSTNPLEPMMWAHYADGFKGCAVIYCVNNDKLPLTRNIYSKSFFELPLHDVKYHDGEKLIPILQCGMGEQSPIEQALLKKNSFWKYESEVRAFITKNQRLKLAASNDINRIPEWEERIFHTHPALIAGVIFGPAFDESKKYLVEFCLRQTKEAAECKPNFYLFDTQLNDNGTIAITKAKQCKPSAQLTPESLMSREFGGAQLDELLQKMGITQQKPSPSCPLA